MLIDSHQHVFWHGRDDAGLIADMDQAGVDLAWLLTWDLSSPEVHQPEKQGVLNPAHLNPDGTHKGVPLSDILLAHSRYPDRFVVGYCPHPLRGNAPALFEAAVKMHGVRVCGEWKFGACFDDPRCLNLYRKAGELGCPVVLHLDVPYLSDPKTGEPIYQPLWAGGEVDALERAMKACPDTNFIGHAPGFWREISGDAESDPSQYPRGPITPGGLLHDLFDNNPNLYADLSAGSGLGALLRDPQHAVSFLTRFADRLLFGRDYYGNELMDFLKTLDLPQDVKDRVFFKNAQGLLPDV